MKTDFINIKIDNYSFVINVESIRGVISAQEKKIYSIPLARKEIIGSISLHGEIVVVLDTRQILSIGKSEVINKGNFVIVEYNKELFALIADQVGEIIDIPQDKLANNFTRLDKSWRKIASGMMSINEELVVILDLNKLINILF